MGLFSFFKSKKKDDDIDPNLFVLTLLKLKLEQQGHTVEISDQYAAIIVNDQLEIATAILPGDFHPAMLPLLVFTINKDYFPKGIEASLVGIGTSIEQKAETVTESYLNDIFKPIMDSFSNSHNETLDFKSSHTGREILWHPKMSDNTFQGKWQETKDDTSLYNVLEKDVQAELVDQKLNWLKLYISRQPDGSISGECLLNNEIWEKGYYLLEDYAKTWKDQGEFMGQKQFIMFRRCDSFD